MDPSSFALRPVTLRRVSNDTPDRAVAQATGGPEGPPLLRGLSAAAASSRYDHPVDEPSTALPPTALVDRDPSTAWAEGWGGAGRWEFATLRFDGEGYGVRAVALTLPQAPLTPPSHLWLVGSDGPPLQVTIPEPLGRERGRVWVILSEPRTWSCLSVVLDGGDGDRVGLSEVELYTELDYGEGLPRLVESLVQGGSRAGSAAHLLESLGPAAIDAVIEAYPTLDSVGKRRAIQIFARQQAHEQAIAGLAIAAADDDPEVASAAIDALVTAEAWRELAALLTQPTLGGDLAAKAYARTQTDPMPLLGALGLPGGPARAGLRRAIGSMLGRAPDARPAALEWLESAPPIASRAAFALAISGEATIPGAFGGIGEAQDFEDRYRFAIAAKRADADPSLHDWLEALVENAEEWMLRSAAIEALRIHAPESPAIRAALQDDYPRVRVAAIESLGSIPQVAELGRTDRWPMVRAAAITHLDGDSARRLARRGLADDSMLVRAAAVEKLTLLRDGTIAPRIAERLADADEWPRVIEAAIGYAREVCVPELGEALAEVVRRGIRPNAWAPDVEMAALAIEAIVRVGAEDAEAMVRRAQAETAPASVRQAAAQAAARPNRCTP
ncbi:MAG: HEAT repeat domain-containing protein [Myxococcota bacterium]